jgi:hypothetical protein
MQDLDFVQKVLGGSSLQLMKDGRVIIHVCTIRVVHSCPVLTINELNEKKKKKNLALYCICRGT